MCHTHVLKIRNCVNSRNTPILFSANSFFGNPAARIENAWKKVRPRPLSEPVEAACDCTPVTLDSGHPPA